MQQPEISIHPLIGRLPYNLFSFILGGAAKTTLDYDYITKYLNENGYPLSKAATGQLYLLQADDIDKTVKNAPLLAISVDSYNQMRALSDLPEITLDSDEYGIAWSFDTLPETITQFNQEVSSIHAGNSTLHKNLVRIIKTQQEWCYLQAVCRLCTSYLMKYAIIFDGNFLLCGQYRKAAGI